MVLSQPANISELDLVCAALESLQGDESTTRKLNKLQNHLAKQGLVSHSNALQIVRAAGSDRKLLDGQVQAGCSEASDPILQAFSVGIRQQLCILSKATANLAAKARLPATAACPGAHAASGLRLLPMMHVIQHIQASLACMASVCQPAMPECTLSGANATPAGRVVLQRLHDLLQSDGAPCISLLWALFRGSLSPVIKQLWSWLLPCTGADMSPPEAQALFAVGQEQLPLFPPFLAQIVGRWHVTGLQMRLLLGMHSAAWGSDLHQAMEELCNLAAEAAGLGNSGAGRPPACLGLYQLQAAHADGHAAEEQAEAWQAQYAEAMDAVVQSALAQAQLQRLESILRRPERNAGQVLRQREALRHQADQALHKRQRQLLLEQTEARQLRQWQRHTAVASKSRSENAPVLKDHDLAEEARQELLQAAACAQKEAEHQRQLLTWRIQRLRLNPLRMQHLQDLEASEAAERASLPISTLQQHRLAAHRTAAAAAAANQPGPASSQLQAVQDQLPVAMAQAMLAPPEPMPAGVPSKRQAALSLSHPASPKPAAPQHPASKPCVQASPTAEPGSGLSSQVQENVAPAQQAPDTDTAVPAVVLGKAPVQPSQPPKAQSFRPNLQHDIQRDAHEGSAPLSAVLAASLHCPILALYSSSSQLCLRLLWDQLHLGDLLAAFQQVALVAAGDFAQSLAGTLALRDSASGRGLFLQSALNAALEGSSAASNACVSWFELSTQHSDHDARAASGGSGLLPVAAAEHLHGLNLLQLRCHMTNALCIAISEAAQTHYGTAFVGLLRIHCTGHLLRQLWSAICNMHRPRRRAAPGAVGQGRGKIALDQLARARGTELAVARQKAAHVIGALQIHLHGRMSALGWPACSQRLQDQGQDVQQLRGAIEGVAASCAHACTFAAHPRLQAAVQQAHSAALQLAVTVLQELRASQRSSMQELLTRDSFWQKLTDDIKELEVGCSKLCETLQQEHLYDLELADLSQTLVVHMFLGM